MHHWIRPLILSLLGLACLGLLGCNFPPRIYRMDIRQGNAIDEAMIQQLRRGMPKAQVQALLGTPALLHTFNTDRWDYYYYFKSGTSDVMVEKHFTVFFKGDRVSHWQ